jgi:hypothetical protein
MVLVGMISLSGFQGSVEERQAHVHAVIDTRVVVVELFVDVLDAIPGQGFGK